MKQFIALQSYLKSSSSFEQVTIELLSKTNPNQLLPLSNCHFELSNLSLIELLRKQYEISDQTETNKNYPSICQNFIRLSPQLNSIFVYGFMNYLYFEFTTSISEDKFDRNLVV